MSSPLETIEKAIQAARFADDKKAEDIVVLDLRKICSFTDAFVICTGGSSLQLRAISISVEDGLRSLGSKRPVIDGISATSGWVVMDFGDILVHIMSRESREFYRLETLWGDGTEIAWQPTADEAKAVS